MAPRHSAESRASMLVILNCRLMTTHDMKAPSAIAISRWCSSGMCPVLALALVRSAVCRWARSTRPKSASRICQAFFVPSAKRRSKAL